MGSYILAKDEVRDYDGDGWLPFNLWQQREYPHGATPQLAALVGDCADVLSRSGARDIWRIIETKYDRPDRFATDLPLRCAEFRYQWNNTPKLAPSKYKRQREMLQRHAEQLAKELERYFHSMDALGELEVDARNVPNFTQLLTEDELEAMDGRIDAHHFHVAENAVAFSGGDVGKLGSEEYRKNSAWERNELMELLIVDDRNQPGIVPDLPEILRRTGQLLAETKDSPPIDKPNYENSERNYFARRLIAYFITTTGGVPAALIAKIVSQFFDQGMSDNEVQQQRGRLPSGKLLRRAE